MRNLLTQYGAYFAFAPALAAMLGSLYYSEVAGFIPCTLCWYQRILMYPLVLVILIGIFLEDEYLPNYVLPFSVLGIFLSGYHYMIQLGIISQSASCSGAVPCGSRYVDYFGFITIPLMALTAFILITGAMALTKWATSQEEAEPALAEEFSHA